MGDFDTVLERLVTDPAPAGPSPLVADGSPGPLAPGDNPSASSIAPAAAPMPPNPPNMLVSGLSSPNALDWLARVSTAAVPPPASAPVWVCSSATSSVVS